VASLIAASSSRCLGTVTPGAEAIHPIKLRKLVADLSLDREMLQDVIRRKL